VIEARIGGDGVSAAHLTAQSPADRVDMIDRWLVDHDLMFFEVNRDDSHPWEIRVFDRDVVEFLPVGVAGDRGAAEYVRNDLTSADHTIRATFTTEPLPAEPRVPYGDGLYFPAETVVPLAEVRQLMVHFVLTGEWSPSVRWKAKT
jgi:hypothetical protein